MGERIPGSSSRIETMNHPLTRPSAFAEATADKSATLSPTGGEGRVRGQRATVGDGERASKADTPHLLVLSAKTETALDQATNRLREFLVRNEPVNLSD